MDAAREAGNIGMTDAANALARLTGREVRLEAPLLWDTKLDDPPPSPGNGPATGVSLHVVGELAAQMFILFSEEDAQRMLGVLLGEQQARHGALSPIESSALEEVGNILASARLNALAAAFKMSLLPSVPTLVFGTASGLLTAAIEEAARTGATIAIATPFSIATPPCRGTFFLFAPPGSLDVLPSAAR